MSRFHEVLRKTEAGVDFKSESGRANAGLASDSHPPQARPAGIQGHPAVGPGTMAAKEVPNTRSRDREITVPCELPDHGPVIIPSVNGFRKVQLKCSPNARLVFQTEPNGVGAEQYRLLRRKLVAIFPEGGTLLISSPSPGDGKTLTAANLSWSLAESTQPTLLLEADLRRPSMTKLFGYRPAHGVESAFLGEVEPEETVSAVSGLALHIAMVTKPQASAARIINRGELRHFLDWARGRFKWVVVDSPPVFPMSDAGELSSLVDAAFLVVRARSTRRELVERSVEALGGQLRGVILNDSTRCLDSYYSQYLATYRSYYAKNREG